MASILFLLLASFPFPSPWKRQAICKGHTSAISFRRYVCLLGWSRLGGCNEDVGRGWSQKAVYTLATTASIY
jgi:hypothetical protein